jgi:acyl-CoA synthetase (AMP-forming)/AMP-acid ligase II
VHADGTLVDIRAGRALVAALLAGDSDAPALITDDRSVDRGELRSLVDARAAELALPERSVVVLHGDPSLHHVVTYLALLDAGHVPLLAADHIGRFVAAWSPDAVIRTRPAGIDVERFDRPDRERHELHPDLALLMSTSGSTGNPKLVRLSYDNLLANARSIVEYLRLDPSDRGITSLPLHYCYGLSVLHSHLLAGAGVVLTTASVVDPCFRAAMLDHGVTNVAGVPHSYDLVERAGAERLAVPSLRFLTVAGGRMAPAHVALWAERAAGWGADFFVMYGQTEATARMAYLPPDLARRHPDSIGVAIPGGELRIDAPDGATGELVYRGPNVMLGYATEASDLALGATLTELRTGDLAQRDAATGLFRIVGRSARFVKPFGLRIDLDQLQRDLAGDLASDQVLVAGDDHRLAVAAPGADAAAVLDRVAARTRLPRAVVAVDTASPIPYTASGKPDYAAVLAATVVGDGATPGATVDEPVTDVAAVFASVLGRQPDADDTFVSLGGDSLAYVECSIRLEQALGHLPADWHLVPVAALDAQRRTTVAAPRSWWRGWARLDSTVLLRAFGICLIVATHMRVTYYPGGAHLLLALVGYNLSRFMMPITDTRERLRAGLRTAWRTAAPVMAWVAAGMVLFGAYSAGTLLLVNNYVGPPHHRDDHWHFWFVEVFVHVVLLLTLLLAIPAVRRVERRFPYGFVLAVVATTLVFRYGLVEILNESQTRFRTHFGVLFVALGWLVHRSTTVPQRLLTSAVVAITITGAFDRPQREQFVIVCLVALVWCREVVVPRLAVAPIALVSTASLWILITHFTVWPPMVDLLGTQLAYPVTIAAGVAAWFVVRSLGAAGRRATARRSERRVAKDRPTVVRMA